MRTIAVISGKGGVGKTTTAINLGAFLNRLEQNVIIVDGNINTPDISLSLGAPIVPVALQHVLNGKNKVQDAIYQHESGMKIMPSSLSCKGDLSKLNNVIKTIKGFDFLLIDSAAGVSSEASDSLKAADECIIVTNAELPAVTGAMKTVKLAKELKKEILGVVVARKSNSNQLSLDEIETLLGNPIIGIIPEDNAVKKALSARKTLADFPRSKSAKGYNQLAMNLLGLEEETFFEKLGSFVSRLGK